MTTNLKVGDVCLTVKTDHPACNDGVLVVIMEVNLTVRDARGNSAPFLIKRIDGQRHVSTSCQRTGAQRWLSQLSVWCAGYKLQRVDESTHGHADQALETLHAQ